MGETLDSIHNRVALSFEEVSVRVHKNLLPTWRSLRHGQIWLAAVGRYTYPYFGKRPIDTIKTADLLKALEPIWTKKNDTAKRIRQRLAVIFDWAKGAGHYPHENPVNGLKNVLPTIKAHASHMAALPWQELPGFMADLSEREGTSARALEFIILTIARSGEARGARWVEIDGNTWTVPASRMKSGKSHRVPLTNEAMAVLEKVSGLDVDLVFPSPTVGRNQESRHSLTQCLKR